VRPSSPASSIKRRAAGTEKAYPNLIYFNEVRQGRPFRRVGRATAVRRRDPSSVHVTSVSEWRDEETEGAGLNGVQRPNAGLYAAAAGGLVPHPAMGSGEHLPDREGSDNGSSGSSSLIRCVKSVCPCQAPGRGSRIPSGPAPRAGHPRRSHEVLASGRDRAVGRKWEIPMPSDGHGGV
jgi:hypothetical protein